MILFNRQLTSETSYRPVQLALFFVTQVDPDDIIQPSVEPMRHGTVLYNLHCGITLNELLKEDHDESSLPNTHTSATSGKDMNAQDKQTHNNWLKSKASK